MGGGGTSHGEMRKNILVLNNVTICPGVKLATLYANSRPGKGRDGEGEKAVRSYAHPL